MILAPLGALSKKLPLQMKLSGKSMSLRTLLEFEVSKEKIVSKICEEYSIKQDEAERLVGECS